MMPQLPATMTVPLGMGELPTSFASRIALINGRSARDFCLDMGFRFQDVVDGKPDALATLAHCGRADESALSAFAFNRVEDRLFEFRGERISRSGLTRGRVRACISCLEEDLAHFSGPRSVRPYQRAVWTLAQIRTCPKHGEALTELSHDLGPHTVHDFAASAASALSSLSDLGCRVVRRAPSLLEDYLLARLAKERCQPNWLDSFRLDAAGKICQVLGAVDTNGPKVRLSDLDEDQSYQAGDRGFVITSGGEAGIRGLLTHLQGRLDSGRPGSGPKKAFYRLYEWLAHESDDPDYDGLRDVVTRHCIDTMPLGPGDEVFGKPVKSRKLHSIWTASQTYNAHPKRLRKLLHIGGYLSDEANERVDDHALFNAAEAHEFIERAIGSLNLKEAAAYLNIPRPHDVAILGSTHIVPLLDVKGTSRHALMHQSFERRELDLFLARLLSGSTVRTTDENGFVRLIEARKRACCSLLEIIDLIMAGKLRVQTDPTQRGLMTAMVNLDEVRAGVRLEEHHAMSLRKTEKALGVTTHVLTALLTHGYLPSRVEVNPVNRCPQTVVDHKDVAEFKKNYVSLFGLAKETGLHFNTLKKRLADVPLAMDRELIGSTFYRRSSIPPLE